MILIQIMGYLGSDPEVRYTSSGQKVTSFRVATNIRKGKNERTVWWRVTVWGDRFDKMISFLRKGSAVIVTGSADFPTYTDREGKEQVSYEITAEMLAFNPFGRGGKAEDELSSTSQQSEPSPAFASSGVMPGAGQANVVDVTDDIPF